MNERHLFTAALHQDDPAAYLREACAGDDILRRRVEALLEAHRLAGAFLEGGPPVGAAASELPPTAGSSVLKALAAVLPAVLRVHLRDPLTQDHTPVSLPGSAELPAATPDATGRYHFFGEIAHGGMGAVLKGRDTDLGRDVAVKVLLDAHHGKVEMIQRFVEEAQVGGQLQHPGIVPVYELGQFPDKRPFFAMKLVKGQTLAELLRQRPSPADELPRFVQIFAQVCQALAYAHARGVIHRDLKPANVMVGAFGEVQVMDWGLAKVLRQGGVADEQPEEAPTQIRTVRSADAAAGKGTGSDTRAGSVLGTPAYMAPEQANGQVEKLDERSDVFGLGAILCEVLTGQPPYTGRDGEAVYKKAAAGDTAEALVRLGGCGADTDLIELARCCLAADPAGRPRDAGAVAAAVTAYQESVAERLRRAELERAAAQARAQEEQNTRRMAEARAAEERRRRRAQLGLAAAVLLLVMAGGGAAGWFGWQRAETVRDVEAALAEAEGHRDAGRWPQARAALERAAGRLGGGGPAGLRDRLAQARADARVVAVVEEIRLRKADVKDNNFDRAGAGPRYAAAFRDYGIDVLALPPEDAAARVRAAPVRSLLLAALDDWADIGPPGDPERAQLRAVANAADDHPWRRAYRAACDADDPAQLQAVAGDAAALDQPPGVLALLGRSLQRAGRSAEAVALLRRAQQRHPADLWVNHMLAFALHHHRPPRPAEAAGYYRAALALRPDSAGIWLNLGVALTDSGDRDGALACERQAVALAPDYAHAHYNLAYSLYARKDVPGALAAYRRALELEPDDAATHNGFGRALLAGGDAEAGFRHLRRAVELAPDLAVAHAALGDALLARGDLVGATRCYRRALARDQDLAGAHNNLGVLFMREGDYRQAAACFRRAADLDPHDADYPDNLGNALRETGDADGAQACFLRALALDPRYAAAHNHLGLLWRSRKDFARAAAAFRRALELDPRLAGAHGNLGLTLLDQGDVAGAVAAFCRAVELDPRDARARHNLGVALRRQRNDRAAAAFFRRALRLDPKFAPSHNELGAIACDGLHDYDGAARHFRLAVRLEPNRATFHYNLGNALRGKRQLAGAAACYRQAIALNPQDASYHFNLGLTLTELGEADAAARFRRAVEIDPMHAKAHRELGRALFGKGDVGGAAEAFRRAVAADSKYADAFNDLGIALGTQGKLDDALHSFRRAADLAPKQALYHHNVGRTLHRQKDYAGAVAAYRRALALDPKNAGAHYDLGVAQTDGGDADGAAQSFRRALALDDRYAPAHLNLANLLLKKGDIEGAIREYRATLRADPALALAHLNLGTALRLRGDFVESLAELRQGHELGSRQKDWNLPSAKLVEEVRPLAELDRRARAVLKGEAKPKNPSERLRLGRFCLGQKKCPAAAARLYADAFAAEPALADDLGEGDRFRAAQAAALAGSGQGRDAAAVDEPGRRRWRKQALEWLRADLTLWEKQAADDPAAVREVLGRWQQDPALSGLRDPAALDRLPEADRKEWRALWADIATLRDQAGKR